jgi:2'-5' RNA ligase superfamily protein
MSSRSRGPDGRKHGRSRQDGGDGRRMDEFPCGLEGRAVMRRHMCVIVTGAAAEPVQQWRHTWDPVMAALVPAHVTITYPEETVDEDLLLRRAESCLGAVVPFRLGLGEVFSDTGGRGGVFVAVHDIEAGWSGLRRRLLAEPMTPFDVPPHVTVAHPRTSTQGRNCHAALAGRRLDVEFQAREVFYTETTGDTHTILRRFELAARGVRPRRQTGI